MTKKVTEYVASISKPLQDKKTMNQLIDDIGDAQFVLLGEASHGTSEFYTIRSELSKRLIEEKGFAVIAVEGDWPSCFQVNQHIKGMVKEQRTSQEMLINAFDRWPTWMWANQEIAALVDWLKETNEYRKQRKVSYYGLDVYSLWESMEEMIRYLHSIGAEEVKAAKDAFACFQHFGREGQNYGMIAAYTPDNCQEEVVSLLKEMQANRQYVGEHDEYGWSGALNALVALHAEQYYRSMVKGGPESWNIRDRHMVDVIDSILEFHGSDTKILVWEHNTHVGDARATDMKDEGMINVGQLLKEKYDNNVYTIGFGTYEGTVIAADAWGDSLKEITVPPAKKGSWEEILHQVGAYDQLIILDKENEELSKRVLDHRAIGVVYDPRYENYGNYVPTNLPERYDAFIYLDQTKALRPLAKEKVLM